MEGFFMGKRKSEMWWKEKYDLFIESGLSTSEFSRLNNLKKSTFNGWIKKFKIKESNEVDNTKFSKVLIKEESIRKLRINGIQLEFEDKLSYEEALNFVIKYAV
jgi:hypothetical protein